MAEIIVPELGESISEGTITKWFVKEGDSVNQGDVLLELETDKVNIEISADNSGVVSRIAKQDGDVVLVGEAIGSIGEAAGGASAPAAPAAKATAAPAAPAAAAPSAPVSEGVINASPAARKRAREQGIDLTQPQAGQAPAVATPVSSAPLSQAAPAAVSKDVKPTERKRMSRRRVTIANRLVEAQRTAAMLTTFNEVDMTAILDLRKRRKQAFFEKNDVNLGFMSFFTKAVVGALKAFPLLNAEIDGEEIVTKKFYDIGIAVSAKEGLVVPVVRDADRMSFAEIEKSIVDLAGKARSNTLSIADLQGGSFTITNGGVFGSLLSTPILNAPQVGILGMHKIQIRPVAIDDVRMENRPMMYLALSYDHRIVDGSEAVRFLVTVKTLLEDPESLLLEG
ncbi:2-oxoglutarate dehydrogenase E2 component (dihydrolipoamide succinyltransferase) [Paenibacillus castaneae]|uniref:2-oxoglutarate dehydrogenase complex dihydrolipoyllysine-residue succinyltransferase n=1 Tax=Paenibacillus castaneae TaxID=474957 RepID=UPI000C99F7E9|nr:2-oxoglutarate dehydrogenase complex dihydrolipoyllysine-residue succinyltransferase [Paenibacillus castaneae]NIK76230.1 2-oxoglutarate dehydrogenase E2 component (dihydrolipoamide succinyltransferase) [Paenibacillus castaneae]